MLRENLFDLLIVGFHKARIARDIDEKTRQRLMAGTEELWTRLREVVSTWQTD